MCKLIRFSVILFFFLFSFNVNAQNETQSPNGPIELSDLRDLNMQLINGADVLIRVSKIKNNIPFENIVMLNEKAASITLEVDDVCDEDCSLLLTPVSDKLIIKNNGVIILTSSITSLRVHELGKSLLGGNKKINAIKLNDFYKAKDNFRINTQKSKKAIDLLTKSRKSAQHLYIQSIAAEGFDRKFSGLCGNNFRVGVILDYGYLRSEFYNIREAEEAKEISNELISKLNNKYEQNFVALNVYTFDINDKMTSSVLLNERSCLHGVRQSFN